MLENAGRNNLETDIVTDNAIEQSQFSDPSTFAHGRTSIHMDCHRIEFGAPAVR